MNPTLYDLIVALGSSNETARCDALEDLQQFKDPDVLPCIVASLGDSSVRVRETAVDALIGLGGSDVATAVAALLSSEDVPQRNAAIEVLEKLGRPAVDALVTYMDSPSEDVRKFAIDTTGKLLSQISEQNLSVLNVLIGRLSDPDRNVSGAAAEALGLAKDDRAIPFLLNHLVGENRSSWLQCNVIVALGMIATEESMRALRQIDRTILSDDAQSYLETALKGGIL